MDFRADNPTINLPNNAESIVIVTSHQMDVVFIENSQRVVKLFGFKCGILVKVSPQ